jgi:hypothetical protein
MQGVAHRSRIAPGSVQELDEAPGARFAVMAMLDAYEQRWQCALQYRHPETLRILADGDRQRLQRVSGELGSDEIGEVHDVPPRQRGADYLAGRCVATAALRVIWVSQVGLYKYTAE